MATDFGISMSRNLISFNTIKNIVDKVKKNSNLEEILTIFSESKAETYENWEEIVDQLKKVKEYNIKNKKYGFLHPPVASIMDEAEMPNIDYINNEKHEKNKFKGCSAPWSSVHVNVDGTLFPCLAISMGNVRDGLKNILSGEKFNEFRII